jgi:hypothetical protein
MSTVRNWYEQLSQEVAALVRQLVAADDPSDEQLEEAPDLTKDYTIDALGLSDDDRTKLEAAVTDLEARMQKDDPRHRFLKDNDGIEIAERLRRFYEDKENEKFQHAALEVDYAEDPLYVDFDNLALLMNPDFTGEMIGEQYLEFADLKYSPGEDPGECYAHLAIDPMQTTVYLLEPSGDPELVADDLDAFIARLQPQNT